MWWRWILWVAGCSEERGIEAHFSKIFLICLVLEMKCSWFINKFELVQKRSREQEESLVIRQVLDIEDSFADEKE